MFACEEEEPFVGIRGCTAIHGFGEVHVNAVDRVDDLLKRSHIDRSIMIDLSSKIEGQCPRQQAGTLGWIICISKARITVEICLIQLFMILSIEVICNIRNLHPQIARHLKYGNLRIHKIHAHEPDDICQTICVIIATRIRANRQNIHHRWRAA
jgi:hypothetical protein